MENNRNRHIACLCKAGCGFFAAQQNDGLCSKCYKDFTERQQGTTRDSSSPIIPNSISSAAVPATSALKSAVPDTTPSIETALPTVATISRSEGAVAKLCMDADVITPSTSSGGEECDSGTESPSKSRKRTRCFTCKKKVGLTGFECRCGGMYCSIHRYSDKHDCAFDYKEHGADHIRKNNPLVVGSKVQKL